MPECLLGHEFLFSKAMCGLDRSGLSIRLQIAGKPWDDVDVLRLGHQYQILDVAHQKTAIP